MLGLFRSTPSHSPPLLRYTRGDHFATLRRPPRPGKKRARTCVCLLVDMILSLCSRVNFMPMACIKTLCCGSCERPTFIRQSSCEGNLTGGNIYGGADVCPLYIIGFRTEPPSRFPTPFYPPNLPSPTRSERGNHLTASHGRRSSLAPQRPRRRRLPGSTCGVPYISCSPACWAPRNPSDARSPSAS